MDYIYEMHAHTSEVSGCGRVSAAEAVKLYHEKGYSGIVITDHFYAPRKEKEPENQTEWNAFIDKYLIGYKSAKAAAPEGFSVFLGLEIRFDENDNDYLVYGISEELLRESMHLYNSKPKKFKAFCEKNNLLFFQAHPFRNDMTVTPPAYLDGIEIGNYNQRHDSRNDIAELWAKKFNLKMTCGSDFHEYEDLAHGGIITKEPIKSNEELVKVLKENKYTLKTAENPIVNDKLAN